MEVACGKISIGEVIHPKTYVKILIKNGVVSTSEFTVEGRKHHLLDIREKLVTKHRKYMRLNPDEYFDTMSSIELQKRLSFLGELDEEMSIDEMKKLLKELERSRHIQIWHDASTVANHAHILFSVNILYDQAVFYTNSEYKQKFGETIDVQSIIEIPELYLIGRCRSTDEQLGYIETREECLKEMTKLIKIDDQILLKDTMRMFHGDGPAAQLENGNQKGGHYFCPNCEVHIHLAHDITYNYQLKLKSFEDMKDKVMDGKYGRKYSVDGKIKPFEELKKGEITEELISRDISPDKTTKKDLQQMLKRELKGSVRVPILFKNNPMGDLSSLNLERYEIALVEPMHDIGGEIDNVFKEIPCHMSKEDQVKFNNIWVPIRKQKETMRNCDKRKALLSVLVNLDGKINHKVICLLKSLAEIQRILYGSEENRTSQEILRLHNSCFLHFVQLKEQIGTNLNKITKEKLYGKYLHNLLVHSPVQYRIINGKSINCEGEERFFNTIKQITHTTSSNRPGHIIGNLVVRHQIETRCKDTYQHTNERKQIDKDIRDLSLIIEKVQYNSLFTYEYIKNNVEDWQSHLERISDFLLEGEGIWWKKTKFGIEFNDKTEFINYPLKPKVCHFRSTDIHKTQIELEKNWLQLVEENMIIPIHKILEEDENQRVIAKSTNFLQPFLDDEVESDIPIRKSHAYSECEEIDPVNEDEECMAINMKEINYEIPEISSQYCEHVPEIEDVELSVSNVNTNKEDVEPSVSYVNNNIEDKGKKIVKKCFSEIYILQTSEGKLIHQVLKEMPNELIKYDKLKFTIKHTENKIDKVDFLDLQVAIQTRVLKKISKLEKEVKDWEREHFVENSFSAPLMDDRMKDPSRFEKFNRIKLGEKLKNYWNIKF